jgi:uncharacterized membrane protein YsdA (DUF1294 family)/cold shock CspA family protein
MVGLQKGQLIKWKDDRGFGFIKPADDSPEVFIHISEIKDATRRPVVGDTIYYSLTQQAGKVRACNAFIVGARLKPDALPSPSRQMQDRQTSLHKARPRAVLLEPFPIAHAISLAIFPMVGGVHFTIKTGNLIPFLLYPTMGLLSFTQYASDKNRAQQQTWRISEQTLILCDLAGGWIGGFLAQRRLRHKISKASYQSAFRIVVGLHYGFWLWWLAFGWRLGG